MAYLTQRAYGEGTGYFQPVGYYTLGSSAPRTGVRRYGRMRAKRLVIVPTSPPVGGFQAAFAAGSNVLIQGVNL